ncbi:MAG: HDIG domain-containing protein [Candidatus Melainabacteria bacterium]|nr:MAG: HDIG domain-containing protein [Candidatus Melainabacteria bacterium]
MVERAGKEIEAKIKKEGEQAAMDMGIMNLHRELIKNLGRLYYRTSYGQNVLIHSLEVGHIAGMLAKELGANVNIAKRAGLLHDIGKAVDQTQEGTHIELGVELARRFGESNEIIHAIEAHHDDVVANSIEAVLVKLADTISAGRPGSRRDTLEIYVKRLKNLKKLHKVTMALNNLMQFKQDVRLELLLSLKSSMILLHQNLLVTLLNVLKKNLIIPDKLELLLFVN